MSFAGHELRKEAWGETARLVRAADSRAESANALVDTWLIRWY